ncbi:hypothetical protein M3J09_005705 [Ascochyta lentis]
MNLTRYLPRGTITLAAGSSAMFPRRGTTGANCQRTACSLDGSTCCKVDLFAVNTTGHLLHNAFSFGLATARRYSGISLQNVQRPYCFLPPGAHADVLKRAEDVLDRADSLCMIESIGLPQAVCGLDRWLGCCWCFLGWRT